MKVLWFSNIILSHESMSGTGTWIKAMADSFIDFPGIELFIITKGKVLRTERKDYKGIKQWVLPEVGIDSKGLPPRKVITQIQNIVSEIEPDIIHVWGTEYYWSCLTAYGLIKGRVLLEMQGLISAIAEKVTADLTIKELMQCIGLKEIVKPSSSILGRQLAFRFRGKFEKDIIARHQYISTQSDWMRAHISYLNSNANVFSTTIGLREEFINAPKWSYDHCEKNRIFTITSTISPYKGLHTLLKAFAKLVNIKQEARLYVAGPSLIKGFRQPGYERYLIKLIKKENIEEKVVWLGPLNTDQLISQILMANVVINPSFIESFSLVLKEALYIGAPTIATYAGAMPELAIDRYSALFYPPGDIALCYAALLRILNSSKLANSLSYNALKSNTNFNVAEIQYNIYKKVLNTNN